MAGPLPDGEPVPADGSLPDSAAALEPTGTWESGRTALVLVAWVIIGTVVCVRTFRWRRGEG